jgi:hypothetical protein
MNDRGQSQPSALLVGALSAWIVGVVFIQWMLHGPRFDLHRFTGLPLDFVFNQWLPELKDLLTAPLGS